ncbi:MAG: hypothetical protein IT165_33290 [Bryobacterales bacterium]|nr:hypothetical protein [Bryobacterales bacterium]
MKTDSSSLLLPDVNVLLAAAWPNHQFHRSTLGIMDRGNRWATCVLTELGFLRLSSNPSVIPNAVSPGAAAGLLREMVGDALHVYLEKLPSPLDRRSMGLVEQILGNKQVTDSYLLEVARWAGAVLITFDTRMQVLASGRVKVEVAGL